MSEFRRFISYIYSYKGSAKLHNTGFAKMEARGEVLRVQVHIKGVYGGNNQICKVYGFFREDGLIKGILLGQFVIKNGMGDMAAVTDRNHVGNTDKCLEDLGGIYICIGQEKDTAMASEWDNIAVDTAFFKAYEKKKPEEKTEWEVAGNQLSKKIHGRSFRDGETERTRKKEDDRVPEQKESVESNRISEKQQSGSGGEVATEEGTSNSGEVFATEEAFSKSKEEFQGNLGELKAKGECENSNIGEETFSKLKEETSSENSNIKIKELSESEVAENENGSQQEEPEQKAKAASILQEQAVLCGEINLNVENFDKNQSECEQKYSWRQLLREYTIVHPFENCDNVEVIRIEPKDLNKLSKEYWVLANNSFLLHGYCSYRYLILCKNKQEEKYFLGVPGVFHPREKVIAGMFGFNEFYMSRNGKLRHGEFGYYVRPVQL